MIDFAAAGKTLVWAIIIGVPVWKLYRWATEPVGSAALRIAGQVEREQEGTREVVSSAPQWTPGITIPDEHDYTYFDLDDTTPEPVSLFRERNRQARLH